MNRSQPIQVYQVSKSVLTYCKVFSHFGPNIPCYTVEYIAKVMHGMKIKVKRIENILQRYLRRGEKQTNKRKKTKREGIISLLKSSPLIYIYEQLMFNFDKQNQAFLKSFSYCFEEDHSIISYSCLFVFCGNHLLHSQSRF